MNKENSHHESHADIVLAVHGGAGALKRELISENEQKQYLTHLSAALTSGYEVLKANGSALDAVEAAVRYLEDCPLFNAGKGAVLNAEGKAELDAAIMDGRTRGAGAVAAVTRIKNPVTAARAVMEHSEHVLLCGEGADLFAQQNELNMVERDYFWTEHQSKRLEELREKLKKDPGAPDLISYNGAPVMSKYGTVGAVALDNQKNLAAATSTGGTMNKKFGRIGDSPLIGAGTYADNQSAAVSGTGHGEYFIRWVAAYEVSALMKYKGVSVTEAANTVIHEQLAPVHGSGGLIALDAAGNCALPFNSDGMFRGCINQNGEIYVAIFDS